MRERIVIHRSPAMRAANAYIWLDARRLGCRPMIWVWFDGWSEVFRNRRAAFRALRDWLCERRG